jgi:acetyl-CoA acetyltransferase family protein
MDMTEQACIPYRAYWCTPFARWQGSLAHLHSLEFAAYVAKKALADRKVSLEAIDHGILGSSVPQRGCFYGLPWLTGLMGAPHIGGPTIAQACATSARVLMSAHQEIAGGSARCVLAVTADRVSNGPHIYYPNPLGPGGRGETEDWVSANFDRDPFAGCDMTFTAENCARKWNVSTAEQHAVALRRYEQYLDATRKTDGHSFQQRYMTLPFEVPDQRYKRVMKTLDGDEGIHPTTAEGLAKLKPVKESGTVTYGGQTHPADGNAGMIITTSALARELAPAGSPRISLRGFGQARVDMAWMPSAPVPATRQALAAANVSITDIGAIKSHNPFAVNDVVFAREFGIDVMAMNNYGCSLIYGHPQGPTGMRAIIELIEELVLRGGGLGLFQGCAAGDTAMAVVIEVR